MTMPITAAIAHSVGGAFDIQTLDMDAPRPDEVLVKIAGVGICHTDLGARDGVMPVQLPAVFGHEGSGTVEAVGSDVKNVRVGDRVIVSFRSCGHCAKCEAHYPSYCDTVAPMNYIGTRLDGSRALRMGDVAVSSNFFGQSSFASHVLTYERNLVPIDDDIDLEIVGPLACGIQTGAGAIMNALDCQPGSSVLITGGGPVGMGALLAAKALGCAPIVMIELHESRRSMALELGADHALDPRMEGFADQLREIVTQGFDHLFDSTGQPDVIQNGLGYLGVLGKCAMVGVPPSMDSVITVPLMPMLGSGITIKGVVLGDADPHILIPEMIALYRQGKFPFDRIVKRYPLSAINQAIADQHSGETIKAVLLPD